MATEIENIILRFHTETEEGKDALRELAALLEALGLQDSDPEVEVHGVTKAVVDIGKLLALLKTADGTTAEPTIRTRTEEGQRAVRLFRQSLEDLTQLHAEVRVEADISELQMVQDEVKNLKKRVSRQKLNLEKFMGTEQFTRAGAKVRKLNIAKTTAELRKQVERLKELKEAAEFEMEMDTVQARAALDLLRRRLTDLEKLIVSPEIKLDIDQAQAAAARVRAITQEITRLKGHAEIDLRDEDFQKKIRRLTHELQRVQASIIRPSVDLTGDEKAVDSLQTVTRLMKALGFADANPEIDLEGDIDARSGIAAVIRYMDDLDQKKVDVDIVTKGRLERVGGVLGLLRLGFREAAEAAAGFGASVGSVGVRVFGFSFTLSVASAAVIALMGAIALLIVGGIAALAASALLAAAALGALAVALGSLLGPGVLLAIGLMTRLGAVMEALKEREQARLAAEQEAVMGDQRRAASARAVADALDALGQANERVAEAVVAANREMEDSFEAVSDAIRSVERAELDLDQARLGVREARLDLKEFRQELGLTGDDISEMFRKFTDVDVQFDPRELARLMRQAGVATDARDQIELERKILNLRDAKLREKEATDGLSDSERTLKRAREDNLEFIKEGINASDQYTAALRAQEQAQRSLNRAIEDQKMSSAQAQAIVGFNELEKSEQRILVLLERIKTAFREAMQPAIDPIFNALIGILEEIPDLLRAIGPGMQVLGTAIGAILTAVGQFLTSSGAASAFNFFAQQAALFTGPAVRAMGAFFKILMNIARAAMPTLLDLMTRFANKLEEWARWTGEGDNMQKVMDTLVDNLELWLDIAYQLARVFVGFLLAAEGPGRKLAERILEVLTNLGNVLADPEEREAFTNWFERAADVAWDFANALTAVFRVLAAIGVIAAPILGPIAAVLETIAWGVEQTDRAFRLMWTNLQIGWETVRSIFEENPLTQLMFGWIADLANFVPAFFQAGRDLIEGLIQGLASRFNEMRKELPKGLLNFFIKPVKDTFEIGSPSKLFYGFGQDIMEGLIEGLAANRAALGLAVEANMKVPMVSSLPARLPTTPSTGGGRTVHQHNHFEIQSPAGTAPDERTMVEQIDRHLRRLGK